MFTYAKMVGFYIYFCTCRLLELLFATNMYFLNNIFISINFSKNNKEPFFSKSCDLVKLNPF